MNTTRRVRTTVPTWKMTKVELARVWAAHHGFAGRNGGWIYSPSGRPMAHGWDSFADFLVNARVIVPGQGIDWTRSRQIHFAK